MKSPPQQYTDTEARDLTEKFIIRYAKKNNIDVIVMGALGKAEQDRMIHGSTVSNVSKYAHCHVIAIRNPARQFTLPGDMY